MEEVEWPATASGEKRGMKVKREREESEKDRESVWKRREDKNTHLMEEGSLQSYYRRHFRDKSNHNFKYIVFKERAPNFGDDLEVSNGFFYCCEKLIECSIVKKEEEEHFQSVWHLTHENICGVKRFNPATKELVIEHVYMTFAHYVQEKKNTLFVLDQSTGGHEYDMSSEFLELFGGISRGVQELHGKKIIHGNIKTKNTLIQELAGSVVAKLFQVKSNSYFIKQNIHCFIGDKVMFNNKMKDWSDLSVFLENCFELVGYDMAPKTHLFYYMLAGKNMDGDVSRVIENHPIYGWPNEIKKRCLMSLLSINGRKSNGWEHMLNQNYKSKMDGELRNLIHELERTRPTAKIYDIDGDHFGSEFIRYIRNASKHYRDLPENGLIKKSEDGILIYLENKFPYIFFEIYNEIGGLLRW